MMNYLLCFACLENNATALAALVVSIVSVIFTWKSLKYQREHNYRSVKPIGNINLGDYEDTVYVSIVNNGIGPLIIRSLTATYGALHANNLIDLIPDSLSGRIPWRDFFSELANTSIPPGEQIDLLIWTEDNYEDDVSEEDVEEDRETLRRILSQISLRLVYTDIYEHNEITFDKTLSWFSREE